MFKYLFGAHFKPYFNVMKNIERYHLITEIFSSKNTDSLRLINLSALILSCT